MTIELPSLLAVLFLSLLLDAVVRPRSKGARPWRARRVHLLVMGGLFGFFLVGSGSAFIAGLLSLALLALLAIASNAKYKMLGEPLLFSDLALLAALVRHPRFYFTAISAGQRIILVVAPILLLVALAKLFVADVEPRLIGIAVMLLCCALLAWVLRRMLRDGAASEPDVDADLERYGPIATLLLYWLRWRGTRDPMSCPSLAARASGEEGPQELVLIVQCESFADPVDLTGDAALTLAGLEAARALAWQWGDLSVSGFGAYTMRTEYGVLFGRSETELAFRRYDPFLTAHGEASYALPARLRDRGYHSLFVHPHDMRFYGRDRLMPAIGFHRLVGEESFPLVPPGSRYIDDGTLGDFLGHLVSEAAEPTLIYAVTMENHGPWSKDQLTGSRGGLGAYMRHVRSSDAMLAGLIGSLRLAGRPAMLVFFGDHRPSIPGVTEPGSPRHTPYVILRFGASGEMIIGSKRVDLTPDGLHHAILRCIRSGTAGQSLDPLEA